MIKALFCSILFLSMLFYQQSIFAQDEFLNSIDQSFQNYFNFSPQEKIYLHTDKSSYPAGENIWFRAYCVDASYHLPTLMSKFLYVELINRQDSVVKRIKIKETDSCFYGNLSIPAKIPSGDYCIRAFTNWMQNSDEAFFFKKNIRITNTLNEVNVHKSYIRNGNEITTSLLLVNNSGEPYANRRIGICLFRRNQEIKKMIQRTDEQGKTSVKFVLADTIDRMRVFFPNDLPFEFFVDLSVENLSDDVDIQFFPEGGNLLGGTSQLLAFKALDANGRSIEVEGEIFNSRDESVASFKSSHRGMGTVQLTTTPGEKYYATVHAANNTIRKKELPQPLGNSLALGISHRDTNIILSVHKGSEFIADKPLYIIMHCRGNLQGVLPVTENFAGALTPGMIPEGITQFVLLDSDSHIYSERLYFKKPQHPSVLKLQTDKERYDRREKVGLSIRLTTSGGIPLQGNFSLAVTDNNMVPQDNLSDNIVSYLLLHSDLKGYIEAPETYFHEKPENTDLLMLTHGWTRHNIDKILTAKQEKKEYLLELEQQIQGTVKNYSDKALPNSKIQVFIPALCALGEVIANEKGEFRIRDLDFPDSTRFMLRGYKEKGGTHLNIGILPDRFKQPVTSFITTEAAEIVPQEEFQDQFKGNYFYQNGVKVYILDEARVVRHRPRTMQQKYEGAYTDMVDNILGQEDLKKFTPSNIYQILMRLPGIFITGKKITLARTGGTPILIVDGTPQPLEMLDGFPPEDVDNVGVIKDGARLAFFGREGANGVIVVNTKHGAYNPKDTPGLISFYPLGYLQPDEFYMPKYDNPEVRQNPEIDYRSTVYWQPVIRTDSTGKASLSFYTADLNATYSIIIEGLTQNGEPVFQKIQIKRD